MQSVIDLIAIHGKLGTGKDTLASFLTEHTPYSFADPLRKGLLALDPWIPTDDGRRRLSDVVSTEGWDEAKKNPEVRRLMQAYGTEAGRDIHGKDCWVKLAEKFVDNHDKVVIRDVRFQNEVDAIYAWEFTKPKLKNKVALVKMVGESRREHTQEATKHASEQDLPDYLFDYLVFNEGTLDDLRWAACYIAERKPPKRQLKLICHSRTVTGVTE
jgi:hypothetical protein